jgi:hypothetical protein
MSVYSFQVSFRNINKPVGNCSEASMAAVGRVVAASLQMVPT